MKWWVILLATATLCAAPQEAKPALDVLQSKAQGGSSAAQYELAFRYLEGDGVTQDYKRAAEWFKRAAFQGNAQAQLELGVMYVNGEGMPPDRREGYAWYWLAHQQSNAQAGEYLKDLERDMPTVQIRLAKKRAEELSTQIKPEPAAAEPARHRHASNPERATRPDAVTNPAPAPAEVPVAPAKPAEVAAEKPAAQKSDARPAAAGAETAGTLRLVALSVKDPMVNNDEAFSLLVPKGWQREGGVVWRHDLSNLASSNLRLFDPERGLSLQLFPLMPYTWAENGIPFFPEGKIYLGNEVRPPVPSASDYVTRYLVPAFRGGANVRVTKRTPLPEVEKVVSQNVQEAGLQKRVSAESVRLEYEENGRPMEEDVFCVVVYAFSQILPGTTFWGPQYLYSFRAPQGQLDGRLPLFQTMASSVKINPVWFGKYLEVVALWQKGQMQAIRNAGELSRYISRTNEEISQMYRQAYEQQQASHDRINSNFSKYIRGVESYHDPVADRRIELPSGYNDAWVSGNGEYILSNQAGFDPNVGSTQNWQRMRTEQ